MTMNEHTAERTIVFNPDDPRTTLLSVNMSSVTKLTTTNYLMWSRQIRALLEGHELHHFIDDNNTAPAPTINVHGEAQPNPAFAIVYLGRHPIAWSSKKQTGVARSSTEAEYRSLASTTAEVCWLQSLLSELEAPSPTKPVIYCDNIGATYLAANPVFHSRMKHLALDYHFVRQFVQSGELRVSHVNSADQLADALTKPLPRTRFDSLLVKIGLSNGRPS